MGITEANARVAAKFLETDAALIGPGPPPQEPMSKHKGSSRPPAGNRTFRWWENCQDSEPSGGEEATLDGDWRDSENRATARLLNPIIGILLKSKLAYNCIYFSTLITHLYGDPAIITRWENGVTVEDRQHSRAFQKMCRYIADLINADDAGRIISIHVPAKYDRVASRKDSGIKDRMESKSRERREVYDWVKERENAYESRKELMDAASKRFSVHPDTVRNYLRFIEAEGKASGAA